ncbi:MAG: hypothetical protein Q7T26_00130 [Dehalococcoidia bacterium]|nr:hypothetical protein [Dehalococcoidia bacterium]
MTIAEIRGKISDTNLSEMREDLLTSDIFGSFRYLPPSTGVLPFLQTAKTIDGRPFALDMEVQHVHWSFWPWLNRKGYSDCEPDVVIGLEGDEHRTHVVMIEAKYWSPKSNSKEGDDSEGKDDSPGDQLAKELDCLQGVRPTDLKWDSKLSIVSRDLVFVTEHVVLPRPDISESLEAYRLKNNAESPIYWTTWRLLPRIIERQIAGTSDVYQRNVLEDMLQLLRRKALTMFEGIDPVTTYFPREKFAFYFSGPKVNVYKWPRFSPIPEEVLAYRYRRGAHAR